ncbi:MAG: cyclic-di-AMP receptor [Clostridium celatum]|uniref:cyclic-di-AMP receptor n=1 Tax=Clostridium sp. TaxID=1506 RepID=UPI0025C09136|nr:cyclic-di-AMP receptor [Clostridium sp.]MBS4958227.1 cyclic-di-AMP receptor [Clostridium sp.]MDU4884796.1 cyclic-di-AMP receptor [Clostridium celatum]MDU5262282.1 cyclic-di-AMP receptor [Clostridium celatum]MDU7078040.1 cyclic-di-AMP receptor [Clostridium celatum]
MKLVLAIVQDDDAMDLIEELTDKNFRVTKLATTGGFLKSGNTTLMMGVEEEAVKDVVKVIEDVCKRRKEMVSAPTPTTIGSGSGMYMPYPIEVEVGGATVFVLDVDQFYKV